MTLQPASSMTADEVNSLYVDPNSPLFEDVEEMLSDEFEEELPTPPKKIATVSEVLEDEEKQFQAIRKMFSREPEGAIALCDWLFTDLNEAGLAFQSADPKTAQHLPLLLSTWQERKRVYETVNELRERD